MGFSSLSFPRHHIRDFGWPNLRRWFTLLTLLQIPLDQSFPALGRPNLTTSKSNQTNKPNQLASARPIYSRGASSFSIQSAAQRLPQNPLGQPPGVSKSKGKKALGLIAARQLSRTPNPVYSNPVQTSFNWRSGRPMAGMLELERSRTRRERTFIGSECAVCEEPLEHTLRGERILQFSCGHVSHEACFYEYIKEFDSQYCPTCNAPLGLDTSRGGNVLDLGNYFYMVYSFIFTNVACRKA